MTIHSALWRLPAIAIALVYTYGGLRLILGPSLMSPAIWTDYQIITILLIAGTIGAGHYTKTAFSAKAWLSSIGFAAVFLTGTWLAARQSLDRQVETTATVQLSAEATNKALTEKGAELAEAKNRLKYAEDRFEQESTGQKCLDRCAHWKKTAEERRAMVSSINTEIAKLGPQKPVNAGAAYFGDVAAAFGLNRAAAISFDALLTPFLKFFVFEIGSIVSLGFALRQSAEKPNKNGAESRETIAEPVTVAPVSANDTTGQSDFGGISEFEMAKVVRLFANDVEPDGNGGPDGGNVIRPKRFTRDEVRADLTARIERGETWPSQRALAGQYGIPTTTLHDWLRVWAAEGDAVPRQQIGRRNAVG